jgi:hypothetical protein
LLGICTFEVETPAFLVGTSTFGVEICTFLVGTSPFEIGTSTFEVEIPAFGVGIPVFFGGLGGLVVVSFFAGEAFF